MSNIEPTTPYVYQPFGIQNKAHWKANKIYGIGGAGLATIHGVSKDVAKKIVEILKEEIATEI